MSNSDKMHAFPRSGAMPEIYSGMTLRDYFAGQAIASVIVRCDPRERFGDETMEQMFARRAYSVADAMLQARALGEG